MSRPPNMNAIAYFEAVARHSRVNLAASELLVSPSAVSQQIKALESQLGVSLFRRVKRRLILTEEGERFYVAASEAIKLLRTAQSRVSRRRQYRSLSIKVSASFGVRWLGPLVSDFLSANPDVDLHINATSELTDFEKENVDLEIRYGLEPPPGLHSLPLVTDHVLPLCTPKMAAGAVGGRAEELLATSRLIHTVKAAVTWREWLDKQGFDGIDDTHGLHFDRSSMSLLAARDGLGVALETATLALKELRSEVLVPIAPELGCLTFPTYWMSCPPRHLNRRVVKAFVTWIEGKAQAHEQEKLRLLSSLGVVGSMPLKDIRDQTS